MLKLEDFAYLPQAEAPIEQIMEAGPGLVLVAGLDPRPHASHIGGSPFLPSGRSAVFRLLMREMLLRHPASQAILVTGTAGPPRLPRTLRDRVQTLTVASPGGYPAAIAQAADLRPDLLVIDDLAPDRAGAAFEAAQAGSRVLSQLDTPLRGSGVVRQLLDLGLTEELLQGPIWILTLQRLPTLCPNCKVPAPLEDAEQTALGHLYPEQQGLLEGISLFSAAGCSQCEYSGRSGEVTALDIYHAGPDTADPLRQPSLLPLETYMLELVARGLLPLEDVRQFDSRQLDVVSGLLAAAERTQQDAERERRQALAELMAARTVLQQKTEALISLEGIGQALIASTNLRDLAARLCRYAQHLCAAERAILYFLHPEGSMAEIMAANGWNPGLVGQTVPESELGDSAGSEPSVCDGLPPAVTPPPTDLLVDTLRAGLRVPLFVQQERVGLMVVHTSQKAGFAPGEVALLQAFANQAALAIQRSALTDSLQAKVIALEEAHAQLVQKERMERELELARRVQQSVLPKIFPLVPGYAFAARSVPARWVGGDFYDVILLDADHLGLVIGDVSDKGMAAALYMAQTHSLIRAEAQRQEPGEPRLPASPERVLRTVHGLLQGLSQAEMFVTVFYGILDIPRRRLTYARAGHDPPLLLRQGLARPLGGQGTLLGFPDLHDLHLAREEIDLQPGDRLILYTDGMIDATNSSGRHYGLGRFKSSLRNASNLAAAELCEASFASIEAHRAGTELYDDATLLVVEVR
jgi:serine phosphatase RsbU (regulator of sigma subunit)